MLLDRRIVGNVARVSYVTDIGNSKGCICKARCIGSTCSLACESGSQSFKQGSTNRTRRPNPARKPFYTASKGSLSILKKYFNHENNFLIW